MEKLLNSLEPAAQERVLNWAYSRVFEQRSKLHGNPLFERSADQEVARIQEAKLSRGVF